VKIFSVYYMKPKFFRDGIMGMEWLREHGPMPNPSALDATHVFLKAQAAEDLDDLFVKMQGECWSPNGEAYSLIERKGLQHTSMSVGDIAVDQGTWETFIVDRFGFKLIGRGGAS
jgi:hypothetical protein